MNKRSNKLIEFMIIMIALTSVMLGLWLWRASKEPPLTVGDRVSLKRIEAGPPLSFSLGLYNTGRQAVRITGVQLSGEGWELGLAQFIPSPLNITTGSLSSWATQTGTKLVPVANYRIKRDAVAVLGLTVRKLAPTNISPTITVTYRYWFVLQGRLQLPLQ